MPKPKPVTTSIRSGSRGTNRPPVATKPQGILPRVKSASQNTHKEQQPIKILNGDLKVSNFIK